MPEALRDTVENAFDAVINKTETPAAETPAVEVSAEQKAEAPAGDRPRDPETGKFVEKKEQAKAKEAAPQKPQQQTGTPPPPVVASSKPKYQRPTTWRKETWGVWDKLNAGQQLSPEEVHLMAEEAIRRDSDFARGVSTYRQEWENAKPLIEAMAPFMPLLQQHNIQPTQWISSLGNAHRILALGSPQEKAARFAQLAQEYGVPLEQLYMLGQDGRLYVNPAFQNVPMQQHQQQQQALRPEDIDARIEQRLIDRQSEEAITSMAGNREKYPHFEEVRETMAGLLQAGLADGLEDAYDAALRHPRHAQLFTAMQEQQRQADEQAKAEERRKAAEGARRKAASPRTGTPTSVASAGDGKKGLRSTIEEAFDSTVGGRV